MLKAKNLRYEFGSTLAVGGVSLDLDAGETLSIAGPSGSGKSTLLHCLAGLLRPTKGEVWLDDLRIDALPDAKVARLRLRRFGMVLQFGEMLPELTLVENVELPLRLAGQRKRESRPRAMALLDQLGVADQAEKLISEVSGGQAQRAAVARAVVHSPAVVFADEPTGALDQRNSEIVLRYLVTLCREQQTAILLVSHDVKVADVADRRLTLVDGRADGAGTAGEHTGAER